MKYSLFLILGSLLFSACSETNVKTPKQPSYQEQINHSAEAMGNFEQDFSEK